MEQMTIIPKDEARQQLGWDPNKKYILFGGAFANTRKNYALLRSAIEELYNQKNIKKNTELSVIDNDSNVIIPQSACMQASRQTDDSFRSTDIDAQCPSDNSYPEGTIISVQKMPKNSENSC